jgi:hypothetical protein
VPRHHAARRQHPPASAPPPASPAQRTGGTCPAAAPTSAGTSRIHNPASPAHDDQARWSTSQQTYRHRSP